MSRRVTRSTFVAGIAAAGAVGLGGRASRAAGEAGRRRRVRFGVNYVPSETWWYLWSDWNLAGVRRDFADIAALGMDHIRIQLLWPEFQPNERATSAQNIDRLVQLLDEAGRHGLDVEVTVLDGQLSGFLFVPAFLIDNTDGHIHNFITDPKLIATQRRLFAALARRIAAHPRFLGFDISNEVYWLTQPLHVPFTPAQGDQWMDALLAECERVAPGKFHVNGVDKWPYETDGPNQFTRRALTRAGSASAIHPWAGFGPVFQKYGPLATPATHYAEFYVQYMQAFSERGDRTIWIEEDGCSKQWVTESLIPRWAEASIRNAASCDHLFGITWWCSHDVNRRYTGFNTLEYDLGLYTNDRRLKPLGRTIRDIISEFDRTPPAVVARPTALVIDANMGSDRIHPHFSALVDHGLRPQIVLSERVHDNAYLAGRGITTLVHLDEPVRPSPQPSPPGA